MAPEAREGELSGKLTPKALKRALFLVESNRFVGNIHVTRGEDEKHIYFTVGGIRLLAAGSRRKTPLGKLLVRHGLVTPAKMREALLTQKRTGKRIGDVLTRTMKLIQPADIEHVVHTQVENEIYDIITWEDGVLEYTFSMPDSLFNKKLKATTLSTDIPTLIDRIKDKIDRWPLIRNQIPDFRWAFRLTRTGHRRLLEGEEAEPAQRELAGFLDGKRSVNKIIEEGEFGTYEVSEMLALFLDKDWVVKVGGGLDLAEESDASDVFAEVRMLERALELGPDDQSVRRKLVEALERAGARDRAAVHLRKLADAKIQEKNVEDAQVLLEKGVKLNPTDFDCQEALFDVYARSSDRTRAIEHGLRLAETYKANRLFNRTKNIVTRIIDWVPRDTRAHNLLAETHEELQETQAAVREFEIVAAILKEEGKDESRLKTVFERILQIDEKNKNARRELARIAQKRWGTLPRVLRTAAILLFALLAFGAVGYEILGRDRFPQLQSEVADCVRDGTFDTALRKLDAYHDAFPFIAPDRILETRKRLESMRREKQQDEARRFANEQKSVFENPSPRSLADAEARIGEKLDAGDGLDEGPARKTLEDLLNRIREILFRWEAVKNAVRDGEAEEALNAYRALVRDVPGFTPGEEIPPLPLPFEVLPAGSRVALDGKPLPPGEKELPLRIGDVHELRASCPGFETRTVALDAASAERPFRLQLKKEVAWKTDVGGPVVGSPLVHGNDVFVASRNRVLSCLDLASGGMKWRRSLGLRGDPAAGPALAGNGFLYIVAHDETLYAIRRDGKILRPLQSLGALCLHPPLVFRGTDSLGLILALQNGRVVWRPVAEDAGLEVLFELGGRIESAPAVYKGILIVGDETGCLIAFDLMAGKRKWETRLPGPLFAPVAIHQGIVFAGTETGRICALDIAEGTALPGWPASVSSPVATIPRVHDDVLLVGTRNGDLVALDKRTGAFSWKLGVRGAIEAAPVVKGSVLYFGDREGVLYALDIPNREIQWTFQTGGPLKATPVLAEGKTLFGSQDRRLYAVQQ